MSEHDIGDEELVDRFTIRVKEEIEKALAPKTPPRYSAEEPEGYRFARGEVADQWELNVSSLTTRINRLAQAWKDEQGGIWPLAMDLLNWDTAQNSIWTFASGASQMPYRFSLVNSEGGIQSYINDPVLGLIEFDDPLVGKTFVAEDMLKARRGPIIRVADFASIIAGFVPLSRRTAGGGAAGPAPRKALAFDRRELASSAFDEWSESLLEEPDDSELDRLVTDYISEANAFWMREAGRLDFNTFVADRIKATERHGILYRKKPEFQSDAEYMGRFRQAVGQFGLGSQAALREIEIGATSGVGIAGFTERVGRTREARLINQGLYSQRFAASMAQTGMGRT